MREFYDDMREKKSVVPSAKRKRSGSRTLKCRLPSDHMTTKEWKERNGPVMTLHLNKPMSWETFLSENLSNQSKEEYLKNLIERFSLNQRIIAEMFGVSVSTLARAIKRFDLNVPFVKGRSPSEEQRAEYLKFLSPSLEDAANEELSLEQEAVVTEQPLREDPVGQDELPEATAMRMREMCMSFDGRLDIDAIANSLKMILGNDTYGEIEIICKIQ